jgi:hypothetical protein
MFVLVAQASNSDGQKTDDKWNKVRIESELLIDCQSGLRRVSDRMLHLLVRRTRAAVHPIHVGQGRRLRDRSQYWIVGIAFLISAIQSGLINRRERGIEQKAGRQVRIGDKRLAKCHRVGLSFRNRCLPTRTLTMEPASMSRLRFEIIWDSGLWIWWTGGLLSRPMSSQGPGRRIYQWLSTAVLAATQL